MKVLVTESQLLRVRKRMLSEQGQIDPVGRFLNMTLPSDWKSEEKNYSAFNEPMGRNDRSTQGKYRNPLPPQTNKYYYNGRQWEVKSLANVDNWRDVPRGYYPPDYPKALEWEKENQKKQQTQKKPSGMYPEGGYKYSMPLINPYFSPEYPLGLSQEQKKTLEGALAYKESEAKMKTNAVTRGRQQMKGAAKSDTIAQMTDKQAQEAKMQVTRQIGDEILKIKDAFGWYLAAQPPEEEGFDWIGFGLLVASILPVVGPVARVVNIGYNLYNAVNQYEKGQYAQAGLSVLFAVLPSASSRLKGINVYSVIAKGGDEAVELEKVLAQNADKWFNGVVTKLGQATESNLPVAISKYGGKQALETVIERGLGKFTEDLNAKGLAKYIAKTTDLQYNDR